MNDMKGAAMKALVKTAKGPGNLELRDVPVPEIGDGDLLIEVKAAGICGSDLRLRDPGMSENLRPPVTLGHEFAGVVAKAGAGATLFREGDRVVSDNSGYLCGVCDACARGDYLLCENRRGLGVGMDGGFARYVRIPGDLLRVNPHTLFRIPENVTFEQASMLDPVCNAYKAVVLEGGLKPGEDVVVLGLGVIGLLAVQIAKLAGAAHIVGVNRSPRRERLDLAGRLGATHVVAYGDGNMAEAVERTGVGRVPLIIDCAGKNELLRQSLALLQKGGKYIRVGYDKEPFDASFDLYVNKGICIQGHFAYNYVSWRNCLKLMQLGKLDLQPFISGILPLEKWEEGFALAASREVLKIILRP